LAAAVARAWYSGNNLFIKGLEGIIFMKNIHAILFFLNILIIGSVTTASAQQAKVASLDVINTIYKAERQLDTISFRSMMTTEWFTERDGDLLNRDTHYFAVEVPGRYHWIAESPKKKVEEIVIGENYYKRVDNKTWEVMERAPVLRSGVDYFGGKYGPDAPGPATIGREGKIVRTSTLEGRSVTIYQIRHDAVDPKTGASIRTEVGEYWLSAEGLLLQRVLEQEFPNEKRFARIVTSFEYGSVKVDGPVVF
jgi:hypothetical protein